MSTRVGRVTRSGMAMVAVFCAVVAVAAGAKTGARDIVPVDKKTVPTQHGKYPPEMVVREGSFDGSYLSAIEYRSEDRKLTVGIWQSEPGTLKTDGYPVDEYCLVLEGHLVIDNRGGSHAEFDAGDSFVIPKGWAGTWKMTKRFKKQYVAFEEKPTS